MICLSPDTGFLDSTSRYINGIPFTVTEPQGEIKGITFLISAANLPLISYKSIRRTLRHVGQVVVDYNYNIFASHSRNHTKLVSTIREAFLSLKNDYTEVEKFGVIGHAIGGKIALMVAAMTEHNDSALEFVLALDPIDKSPVQIANGSLNFGKCKFPIFVTNTGCVTNNGALDIYSRHMNSIKVLHHTGAGHLAYCDSTEELSHWNHRLGKGTDERNLVVKKQAIRTIKASFRWEKRLTFDEQKETEYRKTLSQSIMEIDTLQSNSPSLALDLSSDDESKSKDKDNKPRISLKAKVHTLISLTNATKTTKTQSTATQSTTTQSTATQSTDIAENDDNDKKEKDKKEKEKEKEPEEKDYIVKPLKKSAKVLAQILSPFSA